MHILNQSFLRTAVRDHYYWLPDLHFSQLHYLLVPTPTLSPASHLFHNRRQMRCPGQNHLPKNDVVFQRVPFRLVQIDLKCNSIFIHQHPRPCRTRSLSDILHARHPKFLAIEPVCWQLCMHHLSSGIRLTCKQFHFRILLNPAFRPLLGLCNSTQSISHLSPRSTSNNPAIGHPLCGSRPPQRLQILQTNCQVLGQPPFIQRNESLARCFGSRHQLNKRRLRETSHTRLCRFLFPML